MKTTIRTWSAIEIDPFDVKPEQISIYDIAHHLSLIGRFNGATNYFYSVGQHSLSVCHLCPLEFKGSGLMHDASDYLLGDIPKPWKIHPAMKEFREAESRLQKMINKLYGLPEEIPDIIHKYDQEMLIAEGQQLTNNLNWRSKYPISEIKIQPEIPANVEKAFIAFFRSFINA